MDSAYDMENPWKWRMAAVAACLTLMLAYSAFFRQSRLFAPLDLWMRRADASGDWKTYLAWGCTILMTALAAKFIFNRWSKP